MFIIIERVGMSWRYYKFVYAFLARGSNQATEGKSKYIKYGETLLHSVPDSYSVNFVSLVKFIQNNIYR